MPATPRRRFLRSSGLALLALATRDVLLGAQRLLGLVRRLPDDPPWKVQQVLKQLFGDRPVQEGHVQLDVPTVAADGRVVPVMIESDLPMAADRYVKAIHVLVDNNPDIHLAEFRLTPQIGQAFVSTRIKMRMTSPVRAILETSDGAIWGAAADVRVTVNGCG
ncbi:MAG: thiosulfate oxidation carrier protein SoxY [Gemmatimonadetes bacterium]|nr:MAG: thiosulfate oxidation carrier protein SoxY [Gemmatimonadota bacterium]PYO79459.1 MAG: thiosulfate oxidation carrier protein SoxY [Gemmatimonadota bacterium]TLY55846.1 MAG: thiosulfate oxidation carrier protein SoxY [Gemmatimonadota bacterium]